MKYLTALLLLAAATASYAGMCEWDYPDEHSADGFRIYVLYNGAADPEMFEYADPDLRQVECPVATPQLGGEIWATAYNPWEESGHSNHLPFSTPSAPINFRISK